MYNPYVLVPLLVWAITQFSKFVIAAAQGRLDFRYLYASGGMPSVHSAVVTSLATTSLLIDGPSSALFGITAILAAIVMYDSFGVRRATGEQAQAINVIIDSIEVSKAVNLTQRQDRLREVLGHKPLEVTVGAIVGFILACLFNYSHLKPFTDLVTHPVGRNVHLIIASIGAILVIGGLIWRQINLRRYRHIEPIKQIIKRTYLFAAAVGIVLLLLAFLEWQKVVVAVWYLWPAILCLAAIVIALTRTMVHRNQVPAYSEQHQDLSEKQRWMEGPNKKRRAAKARARKRK